MNELKTISNVELHKRTKLSAEREKIATLDLLEHLAEVEVRQLYAEYSYSSLWEYVSTELKYSSSQTSERVNAMRMMSRIPEIKEDLRTGKLNLTSTVQLYYHAKKENLNIEETKSLLTEITNKSTREVEKILHSHSAGGPKTTKITIEVTEEFLKLMEQVKELKGHAGSKPEELFELGLKEIIKKEEKQITKYKSVQAPELKVTRSRYIPVNTKTFIKLRSNHQCEYVSPITHKRCEAKTNLQFDHIRPFAKGGQTSIQNLRHYCRAHNLHAAVKEYGKEKMKHIK